MDRTEYNRNYYYKRDKTKLKQYRDKYNKKIKKREYHNLFDRVRREEKYFEKYGVYRNKESELMVKDFRKPKEYKSVYYERHREKYLEHANFMYRSKKLKECVDNLLNIPDDNIVNNYGQR